MGEGKVESHNMGPAFYQLTSLSSHVNRPSHFWATTFLKFVTLKIQGQGHGWGRSWQDRRTHTPFVPCQSALPFLRMLQKSQHFQNLSLKIQGQGQMTMMLHNYRSRQSHRTSNGINPSSGFRDMGSAKSGPSAAWFDKFLAHGQAHVGANGQISMTLHNYRSRQVHETINGVNQSSSFRDMRSAKSEPNLWQIWQVFGPKASPYGANGQMTMTVHNYRHRQFHRTSNGENPSSGYRDTGSATLAAARPATLSPARSSDDNTPPARRAVG